MCFRIPFVPLALAFALAYADAQQTAPPPDSPASPPVIAHGYLYIEPFQARFELLMDAATALRWRDAVPPPPATLSAAAQAGLTEFLAGKAKHLCELTAAGATEPMAFVGASVIKGRPGGTLPLAEGSAVATSEAMVGLMWELPTPPAPDTVTVTWKAPDQVPSLHTMPVTLFFGPKSEIQRITPRSPSITWRNDGRVSAPPPLTQVPPPRPGPAHWLMAAAGWGLAGCVALTILLVRRRPRRPALFTVVLSTWLGGTAALAYCHFATQAQSQVQSAGEAEAILRPLLRNVYRAFDHREEGEIYDVLARSVEGELLRKLYLETIQALTLEGREGTRVTIQDFDVTVRSVGPAPATGGFTADCQWTALGRVGHWGHDHTRVNRYDARVTTTPLRAESAWKITGLEVIEVRRL